MVEKISIETTGKKAKYTPTIAIVEFLEALGTWVEESTVKPLHQAPCYSIMADECTDVATIEELSTNGMANLWNISQDLSL